MPKFFTEWLLSLTEEQAREFWMYFDGTPNDNLYDDIGGALASKHDFMFETKGKLT